MGWSRSTGTPAVALVVVVLILGSLPPSALASEPDHAREAAAPAVREEQAFSGGEGMGLWFWPEGDRIFQFGGSLQRVLVFDAGTRERIGSSELLNPPGWGVDPNTSRGEAFASGGRHLTGAVDREQGRFFVAAGPAPPAGAADYQPFAEKVVNSGGGYTCTGTTTSNHPGCVTDVHVLDGASLDVLGTMPLEPPTVEGVRIAPIPRAVTYAPPVAELGWGGRLLMLIEDSLHGPVEGTNLNYQTREVNQRRNGGNVAFVVAFDPESMRQEWAVRVEGCRNAREPKDWVPGPEGDPAVVFRTAGANPSLVVGCHGSSTQQGVVVRVPLDAEGFPAALPVRTADPVGSVDAEAGDAGLSGVAAPAPRQEVYPGPEKVTVMLADPVSGRILMRVDDGGEVWWVFDTNANQYLGTIGIGDYRHGHTTYGLDPDIGRLYVLAAKPTEANIAAPGGLYMADIRRTPLAQALLFEDFADPERVGVGPAAGNAGTTVGRTMSVQPRADGAATTIFQTVSRKMEDPDRGVFRVLVDALAPAADPPDEGEVVRTLDLDEAVGVTEATFDGTARGFGVRAILIGGVEGAARVGPADPVGVARGVPQFDGSTQNCSVSFTHIHPLLCPPSTKIGEEVARVLPPDPCLDAQRELIVAFVGPRGSAVVDASSSRGETQPVVADVRTQQDGAAPVTRCGPMDWPELWQTALVSQPPMSEPGVAWPFEDSRSSCTASGEATDDASWSDPVLGMFSSRVECSEDQVGGWGQARGVNVDGVSVANTLSSFQIYRDPERGMVARVESIARGVDVGGVVKVDTIRGVAESWANGRTPTQDEEEDVTAGDVFNPWNCDRSRPAGTCFERHVFGVRVASPDGSQGYRCGPCGDEDALIEGMNRGFGAYGMARFREPDRDLARGSADGYVAAVTKKNEERFADIVLNNDLLETMVPMLEVVRYAPHNRPENTDGGEGAVSYFDTGTPPRGRQVYQFAAVEVSSTYSVQCLLVYDEATNTCAAPAEAPGSIQVSLSDPDGQPLAGGAFEVRQDVDADGVLGLKDALLPDGACVTAEDGIGTCMFEGLAPGSYLVNQVAAPPGYAKSAEPWVSEVASGEQRVVAFTNVSNVSMIDMTVTDDAGAPLSGATFAAYPDPDADGKVAPDATPAATCTTDAAGVCSMQVPAGSYVLVQTGAPGGLEPIEPVAFTFASGGQVAAVTVVNYPPETPAAPEGAASPEVTYTAPVGYSPPVESIDDTYVPVDSVGEPAAAGPSMPEQIGGTVVRVIRAPGDALRLFARDPQQAVAFTAALALLVLALLAVRRRQLLGGLTAVPVFAFTGGGGTPPPALPRPRGPSGSGGSTVMASTAVLDRPIMGAAPSAMEQVHASVLVATASPVLAAMVTGRLSGADRVTLLAAVDSLEELRATSSKLDPDVLVVDVGLPAGRPGDVYDIVAGLHPVDRVVALIPADAAVETMVTRCVEAGFAGVLAVDGDIGNGHLAYTVRQVAAGKPCYGPTAQKVLFDRSRADGVSLSAREREVALLAANGVRRAEIAKRLFLSDGTIKWHLRLIRSKLGVTNPWDRDELRDRLRDSGVLDGTDEQR